jgi:RNA polymerase sigma factor (sigma-70 family)
MPFELPENYFRHEHGRLVSILARRFAAHPIELCEDAAQAVLLRAVETWTRAGVPEEPGAWLYRVAHHLAIDAVRAQRRHSADGSAESESASADTGLDAVSLSVEPQDDLLRMLFLCADPEIPHESQVALALKTLCGFSTEEIALRFFQSTEAIHKRLQRARARLRERGTDLDMPAVHELKQRVPSILQMLYLLFKRGIQLGKARQFDPARAMR